MNNVIDFYYDFSSSYSHIAHARVNEIEEKNWQKSCLAANRFRRYF
jgi:2-hydroxychromene-2-carboxylate isomerase